MAGDAQYGNVSLLLDGVGENGSTVFTDTSPRPKIVTAYGGAQISTAQSVIGGSSILFDGAGDYLTVASHTDFAFGTAPLDVEFFFRQAVAGTAFLVDFRPNISTNGAYVTLYIDAGAVYYYSNSGIRIISSAITVGTWYHLKLSRIGTTTKLFLAGAQAGSSYTDTTNYVASPVNIGASGGGTSVFNGNISPIRITKGVARDSTPFTPPTAAFPDYAGQVSGIVRDSTNALCARTIRAYDRSTGALVGNTTSNGTTGAYTLNCSTVNEVSVIALDDVAGTTENDLILRTTPA